MVRPTPPETLAVAHTPQAIAKRIASGSDHSYLGDVILSALMAPSPPLRWSPALPARNYRYASPSSLA